MNAIRIMTKSDAVSASQERNPHARAATPRASRNTNLTKPIPVMKHFFILLLFVAVSGTMRAQTSKKFAQDTIIWTKDSLLVKEDFQSKHKGPIPAATATGLFIHPEYSGGTLLLHVEAIFRKSMSYMHDDVPYILNHEQLHFDICEVHARKLRKSIIDKNFKKVNNIVQVIQKMADKESSEFNKEEDEYDKDTEHGLNAAKQQVWNEKVKAELAELEQYSSTAVDIAAN